MLCLYPGSRRFQMHFLSNCVSLILNFKLFVDLVSIVSQCCLETFRNQCEAWWMGTRKALLVPPHFNIVIRWIEAKKRVSFAETRHCGHMWTHVDTVDSVDSVWSQTRHSTQHTSAQHGSGIRLPPGAPGRRLLMRSAVPLGQQTLGKRQLQSSYMYIYISSYHNIYWNTMCQTYRRFWAPASAQSKSVVCISVQVLLQCWWLC